MMTASHHTAIKVLEGVIKQIKEKAVLVENVPMVHAGDLIEFLENWKRHVITERG